MTAYTTAGRLAVRARLGRALAVATLAAVAACNGDSLVQPNLNNPSQQAIDADVRQSVQFRAAGVQALARDLLPGFISDVGILGRESYNYTPTETRNTIDYLTGTASSNAGFNTGAWAGRYRNIRGMRDLIAVATRTENNPLTPAEQAAVRGFANTMWALEMYYVIASRDTLGAVVDIVDRTDSAAAFVRRDSVYRFILGKLDQARTDLQAAGGSFPFTLHSGFTGFTTPSTFLQFNRGLYARVAVHFGTLGGGTQRFTDALTALGQSWIDDSPTADLTRGVYFVFSAAPGDNLNGISNQVAPDQLTHPSFLADIRAGDPRASKVTTFSPARTGPSLPTNARYVLYPTNSSSLPVIRNEELILLRAEANIGLGNLAAATTDINNIRSRYGQAALGTFASATAAIDELLYQKRYSLAFEGHRWVDVRRYGRLTTLPLDSPDQVRVAVQPLPQAECDARANLIRNLGGAANQPFTGLAAPSCPLLVL